MKKRVLSILLAALMVMSLLPVAALADGKPFEFEVTVPETIIAGRTYDYDDSTGVTLKATEGNTTAYAHVLIQIEMTAKPDSTLR